MHAWRLKKDFWRVKAMIVEHIEITKRYSFSRLKLSDKIFSDYLECDGLLTVYIYKGEANLEVKRDKCVESVFLKQSEGFVLTPGVSYCLTTPSKMDAFQVYTKVVQGRPIIEIIDDGCTQKEAILEGYKVIKSPKVVEKPWGYELWIIWTKDYHVLKKIVMKAENQSSLQLHRKKLETNFLIRGEADVIKGYMLDKDLNEDEFKKNISTVNLEKYKQRIKPGMHWTSLPGDVHRVISVKDYTAFEVSTPELDDVIRLHDYSNRQSGRIISEHNVEK